MAAKPFSKEQLNFFKFSTLVLDEFPKVLREIFITMWDNQIATRPGFITWDDSTKVRKILLTSEGGKTDIPTTKSIEEWDCTALFKATIYAKTFGIPSSHGSTLNDLYLKKIKPAPGSFHSSVQSSTGNQEETCALAIDQLRLLRNTLCHSPKPEIIKTDFDNYVLLANDALSAVSVDTAFVDVIGRMSEDDFPTEKVQELHECRIKELQAISKYLENVEQKLSAIEQQTEKIENMEQKLSSIDERTEKIENVEQKLSFIEEQAEKIENVEQKFSSLDERTDEIHAMVKNISFRDKGNVADTLPKPHIPSAVPLFTGREFEIKEITNLMTDKSTRLLNIWGSSGFGKTSTAIEVARHLLSLGYPVYFFKLQGITSVDEFLSQILSIFKSALADLSLTPIDRLVSIFREISCPIFLIFDNLDDLLSHVTDAVARLIRIFDKFLDSNNNINILFTTRELLETMRNQVEGFQDARIRPLSPVSSVQYARQLLPSLSESVVAKVTRISSHVPLAMKLVASLVENNSEEMANKILEELNLSENLLEQLDSPYEKKMQRLFDTPFEQLALNDKHALISLTVFSSATVSKDAAIDVVSGEMGATLEAVRSLKTLVKKSLIDEDPNGKYYSIHPLIYSFVLDKAKQSDFENAFKSSRIRFCRYYLLLFERLNDDFLAGKSVESPQLQDTMVHLSTAIYESITNDLESSQDLFRILSKSEIFLFIIGIPFSRSLDIHKLYDLAIETCSTQYTDPTYLKLYVSKYFQSIAFYHSFLSTHSDIPEDVRKDVMLLSDGSAAKLGCYEGILRIFKGNIKAGIQLIEKHHDGLQKCADQQLIKCLCLQLLALFYSNLKEYSKSSNFSRKAIEVCAEVGNYGLFLIGDFDQTRSVTGKKDTGEQLILFTHILTTLSQEFLSDETKRYFLSFVYKLQQQKENDAFGSYYGNKIVVYADFLLAVLGASAGQERLLDEKIDFLQNCLHKILKYKDCSSSTDESLPTCERLLRCYMFKMSVQEHTKQHVLSIETCRNALDLSLKQYGEQHRNTALCYFKMGLAENDAENYFSALNAFDKALHILTATHNGSSSIDVADAVADAVAEVYIGKGKTYLCTDKFESAIASFKEALKIKRKLFNEDTEEIAEILFQLGTSHSYLSDLSSALAALEQALQIRVELYAEKRSLYMRVVLNYAVIGKVHCELGNVAEGIKCFESALKIATDNEQDHSLAQTLICMELLDLKVDDDLYMKMLHTSLPVIKERYKSFLPIVYLTIGSKQLESGKHEAGLAFLQEALDIDLDVTLQEHADLRERTVSCYVKMATLVSEIGESKLARRTLDRALQMAESLPGGTKHVLLFYSCCLNGLIHFKKHKYVSAIEKLEHALLQLPNISDEACDKLELEFHCRRVIATAHYNKGTYKDALSFLYEALSIIKDRFPDGSEDEADTHLIVAGVAQKMKNRSLVVSNLRLAYKMYSNVLGKNHCKTEQSYIAYVRTLIN